MSEQTRTEQRNTIGRRASDYEVVALRLQYAELIRTVTELRLRVHKLELKVDELDLILARRLQGE